MNKYWSIEEFADVVQQSKSISDVLRHFGLPTNQGYYNKLFHKTVEENNIDISHLLENAKKPLSNLKGIPLEKQLTIGTRTNSKHLKQKLIKAGILEDICQKCGLRPIWNNKPISLHLDHINGDHTDHRKKNLRFLCPNCHQQTRTWGSKSRTK